MREISPISGMSVDEFLSTASLSMNAQVNAIRREKRDGARLRPSTSLIDESAVLDRETRAKLLDKVAELADENYCGRSEMCLQFAVLLDRALRHLGIPSRVALGTATHFDERQKELHRWGHAWGPDR